MQAKLRAIEAREKEKEAKKLAKAKDDLFKVLVDLGLSGVEPAKLKSFLSQHKASLLGTPQAITQPAQSEQSLDWWCAKTRATFARAKVSIFNHNTGKKLG
jgi:hypothetical protein